MSLLQHPIRALDQIDWYLENTELEQFPGAFLLSAGNLCRQTLEQYLFILAFYGELPKNRWLRSDQTLHTAGRIISALRKTDPTTGLTYLERARRRGPRVRKFARYPRSLNKWRRLFNASSHFRNPAARRTTREKDIREFSRRSRAMLDNKDAHLITAAVNELRSDGAITATLSDDEDNTPGISRIVVVTPNDLERSSAGISLKTPKFTFRVVPDDREVPHRWSRTPVVVQHSVGISFGFQLVTEWGTPVDISTFRGMVESFAQRERGRRQLVRRLKRLGIDLQFQTGDDGVG